MKLFDSEWKIMEVLWEENDLPAKEVSIRMQERTGWNKNTTYTVLKRLSNRGIFQTQNGTVTPLVSREEFYAKRSTEFVEETFQGSLPAFLAAFGSRKKLSDSEIDELQKVIDAMRG